MLTPEQEELNVAAYRAYLQGKPTEYKSIATGEWLLDECFAESIRAGVEMRPKAWKLPDPPEGREWHRTDWTEADLPAGTRPLFKSELNGKQATDVDWKNEGSSNWHYGQEFRPTLCGQGWFRTRRPLPTTPKLRPWTHEEIPVGKIVKDKDGNRVRLIVGKNAGNVHLAGGSYTAPWTLEHCTMDDGSPCGVLE